MCAEMPVQDRPEAPRASVAQIAEHGAALTLIRLLNAVGVRIRWHTRAREWDILPGPPATLAAVKDLATQVMSSLGQVRLGLIHSYYVA